MDYTDSSSPEINYLAKDFATFRQLMLDHLHARIPDWDEQSPVDLGVAIVEALAYGADYLSYYQDAAATEAYLGTARLRRSVKRHVRLLDYPLHEGCNSRVWVQVQVNQECHLSKHTPLLTATEYAVDQTVILENSIVYAQIMAHQAKVFETLHDLQLYPEHNAIAFYAQAGQELSLAQGSTSATLCALSARGETPVALDHLQPGHVLILEQVKDPETNSAGSVDPAQRYAVRITRIERSVRGNVPVALVYWGDEDALPFELPIARYNSLGSFVSDIGVARGNMILADYGQTIPHEKLPTVPPPPKRYRPRLIKLGLTYAVDGDTDPALLQSAQATLRQDPRAAIPSISLFQVQRSVRLDLSKDLSGELKGRTLSNRLTQAIGAQGIKIGAAPEVQYVRRGRWQIRDRARKQYLVAVEEDNQVRIQSSKKWTLRPDLLGSTPLGTDYVMDMEDDGAAYFRFGFGGRGRLPQPGDNFEVTYRVGNGSEGNVRAETITHIVLREDEPAIERVRNPLDAQGGTDRESIEEARLYAPLSFQSQKRCVTEDDYVQAANKMPEVVRAVSEFHWVGSGYTTFLYVQRQAPHPVDTAFKDKLARAFDDLQLAGRRLQVHEPYYVALRIELRIVCKRGYEPGRIGNALLQAFAPSRRQDGGVGFFYPDNLSFGQSIYGSQLIARASAVAGVAQASLAEFRRMDEPPSTPVRPSIPVQPLEIIYVGNARVVARKEDERDDPQGTILFLLEGGL